MLLFQLIKYSHCLFGIMIFYYLLPCIVKMFFVFFYYFNGFSKSVPFFLLTA